MVTLRPLDHADIPAHAALLAAAEAVDHSGEHHGEADLAEQYANPGIELGHDVIGAFDGDQLVGHAAVVPRPAAGSHLAVHLEGTVRPDHRGEGIGSRLLTAALARADVVHRTRYPDHTARYSAMGLSGNAEQEALFAAAGLVPARWTFTMRAQLDEPDLDAPPELPGGHTLLTWTPDLDEALRTAHNEVFLDHPEFTPWSPETWAQGVARSRSFRPALSVLLVADAAPGRVVSYVQTTEFAAHAAAPGRREAHVARVGTRRELRGRGVAGALLREVMRRCRTAGFDDASLHVDAENPTGALGVYERAGFRVDRRWTDYMVERPPLEPTATAR